MHLESICPKSSGRSSILVQNSVYDKGSSNNDEVKQKGFVSFNQDSYAFSGSHSKVCLGVFAVSKLTCFPYQWMVSYDIKTGGGFIIMHSFPKTPYNPFPRSGEPQIFPPGNPAARFQMSQYMFCATLSSTFLAIS